MSWITSLDPIPGVTPPPPPRPAAPRRRPGGAVVKYDSAQTTNGNREHWANADALGPVAANSADVRAKLRHRSRYECENNGYAKGLVRGRAEDTIGVCPRLQLGFPEAYTDPDFQRVVRPDPSLARAVELRWKEWCDATGFADKLRLMDMAETRDGEAFAILFTNPALPETGVQLDLQVIEADQCSTPNWSPETRLSVDGIRFDEAGNPREYDFLRDHPGEAWGGWTWNGYDTVPAARVIHLFEQDRPGQRRGIPALAVSLPLFAQLRRYTLATLDNAETAANITAVLETDYPAPDGTGADPGDDGPDDFEQIPIPRRGMVTLPSGVTMKGFDPRQPHTGYREFKGEILTEAGVGSTGAPRNISTGSSAEYNYSSGRLDRLPYHASLRIRRDRRRRLVLDRVFAAWLAEAALVPGYLPPDAPPPAVWSRQWRWGGFESIDPVKDATANEIALQSGQTTLERVCAERGDDWEEVLEQQAREMRKRADLKLPDPAAATAGRTAPTRPEGVPLD